MDKNITQSDLDSENKSMKRININKSHESQGFPIPSEVPCCVSKEGSPLYETSSLWRGCLKLALGFYPRVLCSKLFK